jgi:N-formylglutamate amidohydrolase
MKHYQKNENVHGIMIEVNRKLYMDNGVVDMGKVKLLNELFSFIFGG